MHRLVTDIETGAFSGTGLTTVTLPKGPKSIQNFTFDNSKLTSINILQSITKIGDGAFRDCTNLSVVTSAKFTAVLIAFAILFGSLSNVACMRQPVIF